MLSMVAFFVCYVAIGEGRSAFPVYASAYAPQGGIDCSLRNKWHGALQT